ncbi:pentatricopeptide repeat-containing protein At1g19720 [Punica granatum]|uniref:DYW domain-containing protein n=2 Tax=Punica granatum TaxID=22663 RepID=A0A218X845_PUNGR|nr:pentatricopeptide repeat-containing protein At1g19720 [Punica granatum]OWM80880.1 hypothetical protein CDL15_Pgr006911 [Punica granatum]PKI35188.1 hypothetical protein CRG98_044463 [Punica granatum]
MENLIIPSKSKPPAVSLQHRQDRPPEFTSRTAVSLPRKANPLRTRLASLSHKGRLVEAVEALDFLARTGLKINPDTYTDLLDRCIDENSLHLGRRLHSLIHLVEVPAPFVETKLVSMYAKCGSLEEARKVFNGMRERNLFTWSAMIGAFSRDGRWREVVGMFYSMMVEDGVLPDDFLFPKILQACGNCEDFETGKLIHSLVIRGGNCRSARVINSVLAVYAKCGKLSLARRVFENMEERDVVSWNSLISGYSQNGQNSEAHRLFKAMVAEGTEPSLVTWNALIAGHCQSGNCDVAMELMKEMDSAKVFPDVFTWTSVISGFAQNGRQIQALDLFGEMVLVGVEPNGITLASAISACASLQALDKGKEIHSVALKLGLGDNVLVGNSLIDMYSKCGEPESAQRVFDSVHEKDIYTWNSMIGGYFQAGYCGKAHEIFLKMQESDVLPNIITWNVMISGYMQNGDEDQAINLFHKMEKEGKIRRNTASWNSIVAGYAQNGQKDRAFGVLRQMQSVGFFPNWVTILSILPSCANLISAKKVKEIHAFAVRHGLLSILPVANSLINTYAKSGDIEYSRRVFDGISRRDIISWNSLFSGYVLHGCSHLVIDLFNQMRALGFKPNRGTFVSLLNAYSRVGAAEEGIEVFSSITKEYLIVPALEHYSAVVDLYGRAGRLEEAVEFIEQMPVEPDSSAWLALFTACRIHGNADLALLAAERLLELEPGNDSFQPMILNAFALHGKPEHVLKLKKLEKDGISRHTVGQSWTEIRNTVHTFISTPTAESHSKQLLSWVRDVKQKAEALKSCDGGLCIEEEHKEEIGGIHSEKLAIGFSLLSSPHPPRRVRVMKNTRMCEDCHRNAKYVSSTFDCEIYLSDTQCLHHFKGGNCSCRDYW